ncbi:hypothetical protein DPMN_070847, partial [Dreissena polymorpha]
MSAMMNVKESNAVTAYKKNKKTRLLGNISNCSEKSKFHAQTDVTSRVFTNLSSCLT